MQIKKVNKKWTCRVWYYVNNEKRSSYKGGFLKKADAELWGAEIERRAQLHPDPTADNVLLSNLLEDYVNAKKNRVKPESVIAYKQRAKHILKYMGDCELNKITTKVIQNYASSEFFSPNAYDFFVGALRYAYETELMFKKPQNKVITPHGKKRPVCALNMDTLIGLLAAFKKHSLSLYIAALIASLCGLRCGEVLGLEWDDFDFTAHTVKIQRTKHRDGSVGTPKSGKSRLLHVNAYLETELLEYKKILADKNIKSSAVVVSFGKVNCSKGAYSQDAFYSAWRRTFKRMDCERINFHSFRHTFATLFISAGGGSIEQLKIALGHSNISTTQRYTHNDDNVKFISQPIDILGKTMETCSAKAN